MIPPKKHRKTQLETLINQGKSDWQQKYNLAASFREQQQRFMLKRLQLQSLIMLLAGLTLTVFFLWASTRLEGKIYAFKIGLIVQIFMIICWGLCKTPLGRRYPHLIFLSFCWCVTCTVQIDKALLFNNFEPGIHRWILMFVTQATIVPVLWRMHLISQVGTIICYLILFIISLFCHFPGILNKSIRRKNPGR
jgi:adenylate cyclase